MARKNPLRFHESDETKLILVKEQEKQIKAMYAQLSKEASKMAEDISKKENISSVLRRSYLKALEKRLNSAMEEIGSSVNTLIPNNMKAMAQAVVNDNLKFFDEIGLSVKGALSHVPTEIVNRVVTGKLYESNWTLSKAIWSNVAKNQVDIEHIVAKGIALNKSAYDIAKDLETYVDPLKAKPWEWRKVYPNSSKVIDYNSQRLARTMVSHAYQQSIITTVKDNPFVIGIKWQASHSARTCQLCISRSQDNSYGLGDGVFPKGEVPLDHPNGLCTFTTVMKEDDDYVSRIADWVKNGQGYDAELDTFAQSLLRR